MEIPRVNKTFTLKKNVRKEKISPLFLITLLFMLTSCYSFNNVNLGSEKTVQINNFPNNTSYNPDLSQNFTIALQNRFYKNTTLKPAKENPDMLIDGEIVDYNISPTTISSPTTGATGNTVQAAQNKLSITVKVHYENNTPENKNKSFDRSYTDEATFNNDLDINTIESSQVKIVMDRIINKIFNDIVADW